MCMRGGVEVGRGCLPCSTGSSSQLLIGCFSLWGGGGVAEVERKLLWLRYFPPLDAHTTPVGSPLLAPHVGKELRASERFRIGPEPRSREMGEPGVAPV